MEKITLLPFFALLSSKMESCLLPKNKNAILGLQMSNICGFSPQSQNRSLRKRFSHNKVSKMGFDCFLWTYKIFLFISFLFISGKSFAQQISGSSIDMFKNVAVNNNNQYGQLAYAPKNFIGIIPKWETLQSAKSGQSNGSGETLITFAPIKINLDQIRNGSGTSPTTIADWVNGNAGASNAHYVEGWGIPYRAVFTSLPAGSTRTVDIEWDTKQSSTNAIDFITNYDLIDFVPGTHVTNFGHVQETINPKIGYETIFNGVSPSFFQVPDPSFPGATAGNKANALATFNAIKGTSNKGEMGILGGTITKLEYLPEGSLANPAASTRLRVTFTNTSTTVILSWAGHIAKADDWGLGNSAAAVSGSPYHTRLISYSLDNGTTQITIGNQDRSLSAAAVVDPPACTLGGNPSVQCSEQNAYTSGLTDINGYTYKWDLVNNTSSATIESTNSFISAVVNSGTGCGTGYTVRFTLYNNNTEISHCDLAVGVNDTTPPEFTLCPSGRDLGCNPESFPEETATATDNCGIPVISSSLGNEVGTGCSRSRTRTYTATDACGNFATCSQIYTYTRDAENPTITLGDSSTLGCNPTDEQIAAAFGDATVQDNCSTELTAEGTLGLEVKGNGCSYSTTKNWTVTDDCGNTGTASQMVTYTKDAENPTITLGASSALGCNPTDEQIAAAFGGATVEDNCSTELSAVGNLANEEKETGCSYSTTKNWSVTDDCGNLGTASQKITYTRDTQPPVITCPDDATVDYGAQAGDYPGNPAVTDECGTPSLNYDDSDPVQVGCQSVITRTWTATDDCGNSATCVQHIFIIDRTAPVIDCNNGDPIASDDSGTVYLYQNGTTYTAMDASGNTSSIICEENGSGKIAPIKQLEQINADSKIKAAPTEAKIEIAGFDAHPVPFKDPLTIKYKFDYKSDVKIEVFNAQGISVLSKEDTNGYFDKEIALDLKSNRGEQMYIVKVTTDRGSSTKKVLSSK